MPVGPSNLRLRVIYGLIGAAMLLGSVWFSPWTFGLFFAGVQAVMLKEFYRIMRAGGYQPAAWIGIGVSFLFLPIIYFATIISFTPNHSLIIIENSPVLFRPMFFHGLANGKAVIDQMA